MGEKQKCVPKNRERISAKTKSTRRQRNPVMRNGVVTKSLPFLRTKYSGRRRGNDSTRGNWTVGSISASTECQRSMQQPEIISSLLMLLLEPRNAYNSLSKCECSRFFNQWQKKNYTQVCLQKGRTRTETPTGGKPYFFPKCVTPEGFLRSLQRFLGESGVWLGFWFGSNE